MKSKSFLDKGIDTLVGGHKYTKVYNSCAEAVSRMMANLIFDYDKAMYYLTLAELHYKNLNAILRKYSLKRTEKELRPLKQDINDFCGILGHRKRYTSNLEVTPHHHDFEPSPPRIDE